MPRRLLGILILLLESVIVVQAQGDAVLLKVGSERVGVKEFEYYYKRSVDKDVNRFLAAFVDYKLNLVHAKEQGLDTSEEYRLLKEAYSQTDGTKRNDAKPQGIGREWIKLWHVTMPLKQHASKQDEVVAKAKVDSLYMACKDRADWMKLGEELPWTQARFLLKEWNEQLRSLPKGEVSAPFYSPIGIHLLAWIEKKHLREERTQEFGGVDDEFRKQEVADGLLMAMLENADSEQVPVPEKELEHFFERHREEYGWGIPHFRGVVVHCKNKKQAKEIKKYLRKYPQELWLEAMKRMSAQCEFEVGLFRIGENPYVDKLVFKCGGFSPLADYPYAWVMGDRLKKGPKSMKDVRKKVEAGYKDFVKNTRMAQLREKYKVEINEEVLKTVNNEGNN